LRDRFEYLSQTSLGVGSKNTSRYRIKFHFVTNIFLTNKIPISKLDGLKNINICPHYLSSMANKIIKRKRICWLMFFVSKVLLGTACFFTVL